MRVSVSALILAACGVGSPITVPATGGADLRFEQQNNYAWTGVLSVAETEVAEGAHFTIDWSALTVDVQSTPFDGAADRVDLLKVTLPRQDFLDRLVRDDTVNLVEEQWLFDPAPSDRSVLTSQLEIVGNGFEPDDLIESSVDSWVIAVADPDGEHLLRALKFVTPRAGSTNTLVPLVDGEAAVTSTVDLHTMPPIAAMAGTGPYHLDWSTLTLDTHGNPLRAEDVDQVLVARVDVATPADVEPLFTQLEQQAAEVYRLPLGGGAADASLDLAVDDAGIAFGGFTTAGVWLVALECSTCTSPAPPAVAVVEVTP